MNRNYDRSEGYQDHGFNRLAPEHEPGREEKKRNMLEQRPTQATAAFHIMIQHSHARLHVYTTCAYILVDAIFADTHSHSHYSHKVHTLSCAQPVTDGHDTLTQPKHTEPQAP